MPKFDLKGIRIAEYKLGANNAVSYENAQTIGDAMAVNMELRFAEARLYAEGRLAEYVREVTGGTVSIAEKYIRSRSRDSSRDRMTARNMSAWPRMLRTWSIP